MAPHLCPICHNTFSRKEHLRRHLGTHSAIRRFVCETCSKGFNRRDALRRHIYTCVQYNKNEDKFSEQIVRTTPSQVSTLAERDELETCVNEHGNLSPTPSWDHLICQLESDSYQESIRGGASRSLGIFVRVVSTFAITGIFDPTFALPASAPPHTTNFSQAQGSQMPTWGLPGSVTMMDASDATASCVWPSSPGSANEKSLCPYYSSNLNHESARIEALRPTQFFTGTSEPWSPSHAPMLSIEYDDCLMASNEIISRLRNEISQKRIGHAIYPQEWNSQLENECLILFGPSSLMKLTEEYWSTWYIHWPVIHRATFRISLASASLIASMVLLAASYSSYANTRELARYWADAVETIVFADEYFGSTTVFSALNAACLERRLRALQAGHAMCIYQTFEGGPIAKRRVRRSRFNEVVAMARELGFQNGRHTDVQYVTKDTFNWKEFILKEELIRTLTYMIVLDSGLVIIYNTVPRVMVPELQTDLVCPETCFQAATESECLQYLLSWASHPLWKGRRMSIADAIKILSETNLDFQTQQMFTQFGELNLFVLTAALHSTIFYIRNSILPFYPTSAVLNIMRNWRRIWTLRKLMRFRENFGTPAQSTGDEITQRERWRQTGFMKDAMQFWILGQIMLDSKRTRSLEKGSRTGDNNAPSQFDQPYMSDLKQYLSKAGGIST
ncbi:uncharacterized protein A1O9_03584 [Exophiala aquamarina CBS 119918]|uniref:C2H2-type domain-containing protein n=1 Tax=Exophiala aquamarina CBS 119918 TaxID=1182545 RepID=A0A072PQI3_9EURO|nr:uncharacterized protein A1O9_03584 [Exophiala aquamarina CBS 119918]KEF62012.1 hypothetical protein A1O9_03584 [Exophiala aquamarina CBS 119918]